MSPEHPNNMAAWDVIECQRGHETHATRRVSVALDGGHGYPDLPVVPSRLATSFEMDVWDPKVHPVDGGPYCPAHDAVSQTIVTHHVWEPRESILAAQVCSTAPPLSTAFDMGAQLGWFSLLAASFGLGVVAWEADPENRRVFEGSVDANGWSDRVLTIPARIGPDSPEIAMRERVRFVKMDIEGAEPDGWRILGPMVADGLVDHVMVEVSPVFHDGYPALVNEIIAAGFRAYTLPPKSKPPAALDDVAATMEGYRFDVWGPDAIRAIVERWHQEDLWFVRDGATW